MINSEQSAPRQRCELARVSRAALSGARVLTDTSWAGCGKVVA